MRNTTSYEMQDANNQKQFITLDSFVENDQFYFALQLYNQGDNYFAEWRLTFEELKKFIDARMKYVEYQKQLLNLKIEEGLQQVEEGKTIPGEVVRENLMRRIFESRIERMKDYIVNGPPGLDEPGYKQYLVDTDQLRLGDFTL